MDIKFYSINTISELHLKFAVICASYRGRWVYVRHRDRQTWEIPGGHREISENINQTASRELFEESGAAAFDLEPLYDYSVTQNGITTYGRLYFCRIHTMGCLPQSEIAEVKFFKKLPSNLTYADIQPVLFEKMMEHMKTKLLQYLEQKREKNINMINFMKNYSVCTVDTVGESLLIRGQSDENWIYISSESYDEFKELIERLDDEDRCFAVLEDWMCPYIIKDRTILSQMTSLRLIWENCTILPAEKYQAVRLTVDNALYIYNHSKYQDYLTIEYIEDRIFNGIGLGIFDQEKLIAWAITHDDGAIGFLHVLEEYRGRGYGTSVLTSIAKALLERGEVPFVHIEEDNRASMNLALKIGFKKDWRIHWIKLK